MKSPFVRASCGCIVIPLSARANYAPRELECLIVRGCDGNGNLLFSVRNLEAWKVVFDSNHSYHEATDKPRELTERETRDLIRVLGELVSHGYSGLDLARSVRRLAEASWPGVRLDLPRPKEKV